MNALLKRVTRKLACVVLASLIIGCTAPAGTEKTSKAYAATGVEQGTVSTVQGDGFKVEFRVESA